MSSVLGMRLGGLTSASRPRKPATSGDSVLRVDALLPPSITQSSRWQRAREQWWPGDLGVLVAISVLTVGLLEAVFLSSMGLALISMVVGALLLARRLAPLVVLEGTLIGLFLTTEIGTDNTTIAGAFAMAAASANAGIELPPRRLVWAPVLVAGTLSMLLLATGQPLAADDYVGIALLYGAAMVAGAIYRRRTERTRALEERALQLEADAEAETVRAVEGERARIARELHDVVSHSISVITIQTQSVRRRLGADHADEARDLQEVETVARQAMGEMRRLLGVLRASDAPAELEPQPGLAQVQSLLEVALATGRHAELEVTGAPRPLPPGVDLAAYRVVQEAITNVLKHTRATRLAVRLHYLDGHIEVVVEDNGVTTAPAGTGFGLIGMRERVALYGGTLEASPTEDGGFRVRARIPVREEGPT